MPAAEVLVLLDLDGTLIGSRGVGRRALEAAFVGELGWHDATRDVSFGGMTDPGILQAVFEARGLSQLEAGAAQERLISAYLRELAALLAEGSGKVWALPGAAELVEALAGIEGCLIGVLTGNVEGGARLKLRASGLGDSFFSVGAFGDEAPTRNALLPVALARANASGARLTPAQVVVVGDTPRDVAVARAHGARAVGLSTGATVHAQLAAAEPDVLLKSLEPIDQALAAIMGTGSG